MCVTVYLHVCIVACVCLVPKGSEEHSGSPGTGVTNDYDSTCGTKNETLQEQQVLLNLSHLSSPHFYFLVGRWAISN